MKNSVFLFIQLLPLLLFTSGNITLFFVAKCDFLGLPAFKRSTINNHYRALANLNVSRACMIKANENLMRNIKRQDKMLSQESASNILRICTTDNKHLFCNQINKALLSVGAHKTRVGLESLCVNMITSKKLIFFHEDKIKWCSKEFRKPMTFRFYQVLQSGDLSLENFCASESLWDKCWEESTCKSFLISQNVSNPHSTFKKMRACLNCKFRHPTYPNVLDYLDKKISNEKIISISNKCRNISAFHFIGKFLWAYFKTVGIVPKCYGIIPHIMNISSYLKNFHWDIMKKSFTMDILSPLDLVDSFQTNLLKEASKCPYLDYPQCGKMRRLIAEAENLQGTFNQTEVDIIAPRTTLNNLLCECKMLSKDALEALQCVIE